MDYEDDYCRRSASETVAVDMKLDLVRRFPGHGGVVRRKYLEAECEKNDGTFLHDEEHNPGDAEVVQSELGRRSRKVPGMNHA